MTDRATTDSYPPSPPPEGSPPTTIQISPSQHLEQLPIAALLAFVPRLRTSYRVLNGSARPPVATGRDHYRLRLGAGQTLYLSDNLLDLVRLIDGRRSIQALCDALAEQQGRPVHPAEIVYLLRRQLVPGGLVELSLPLALPEPETPTPPGFATPNAMVPHSASVLPEALSAEAAASPVPSQRRSVTRPLDPVDDVQWIPPGRRAEMLRAAARPLLLRQRLRRASYINLVATFLMILAAGAAFAVAHAGFSQASFSPFNFNLSSIFGGPTPTSTIAPGQTPTARSSLPPIRYVVQDGDTLAKIAKRFKVTVRALLLVNGMKSPAELQSEQVLIIPTVYHRGANPALLAYPIFYVVQSGDSIYSIASFFGTTANTIIQFNHISNPDLIKPGDSLVIPAKA